MSDHQTQLLYQILAGMARLEIHQSEKIMSLLQQVLAEIAEQRTVISGVTLLLVNLKERLLSAHQAVVDGDNGAALAAVLHDLTANTDGLAAAVQANTVPEDTAAAPSESSPPPADLVPPSAPVDGTVTAAPVTTPETVEPEAAPVVTTPQTGGFEADPVPQRDAAPSAAASSEDVALVPSEAAPVADVAGADARDDAAASGE